MKLGWMVLLAVLAGTAHADRASEAKEHYQNATAAFAVGDFLEAAEEYQKAFKLKPDAALLYNAAQAFRLAGKHEKAMILYRNYLQLYPKESNRAEVQAQIAKLKEAVAAAERATTNPPTGAVTPKQEPITRPEPKPEPVVAPQPEPKPEPVVARTDAQGRTPVYKKWWLWTIVGVVVVGAAVGTAVALTVPSGTWENAPAVGPGQAALSVQW
jgi:tetratricopeptide (TPR) repeat protein